MANFGFSFMTGVEAYSKESVAGYYTESRFAVLNDPSNQVLTVKGRVTKVRNIDAGGAGTYSPEKGWLTQYGGGKGVTYQEFAPIADRAKSIKIDAIDEFQSYIEGAKPTAAFLQADFVRRYLAPEIDAASAAALYNNVPLANRHLNTAAGYQTDPDNILATLNNLEAQLRNKNVGGKVWLFISATVYANLVTAIQNKSGLANMALVEQTGTYSADNEFSVYTGDSTPLQVNFNFVKYGSMMNLIIVPDDRMYTAIILLSGAPDEPGQEQGHYIPDITNEEFGNIDILAIPEGSAFTSIKYFIQNLTVPYALPYDGYKVTADDIGKINNRLFGNIAIGTAGIDQRGNNFEYDTRAIYGAGAFDVRKSGLIAITGPIGAAGVTPTGVVVSAEDESGFTTVVNVGDELVLSSVVSPVGADQRVTYTVTPGTGTATVNNQSNTLTGVTAGTVTVTATSVADSSVSGTLTITVA